MQALNKVLNRKPENKERSFTGKLLKSYQCPGCKEEIKEMEFITALGPDKGKPFIGKQGCKCHDIALGNEALLDRQKAEHKKLLAGFDSYSIINADLINASFENYHVHNKEEQYARQLAEEFVKDFDLKQPRNLMYYGPPQVGKSHLSVSITKALMEKGHSAVFISFPKLLTKIKGTFKGNSEYSQADLLDMLRQVDCLVIDDLGAEKNEDSKKKAWSDGILYELVDDRLGKHTIYTSNLTDDGLADFYEERTFKRIMKRTETCVLGLENKGEAEW